jgi:predicted amidophosphoribosyltransferase
MNIPNFTPRIINGAWRQGFALDVHTLRSVPIGHDEHGHLRFDTTRSEVGELLYQLKFKGDRTAVDPLAAAAEAFLGRWHPPIDAIVPVPPSTTRAAPPFMLLAEAISKRLSLPLADCVTRRRDIPQLKNVTDLDERAKLLDGLHSVDRAAVQSKNVLLFDDLFRSGATMNAIAAELRDNGGLADLFALTITRTRSNA